MTKDVADRTLVISRLIKAPVAIVWGAWMNAESLPKWWGPDGFFVQDQADRPA